MSRGSWRRKHRNGWSILSGQPLRLLAEEQLALIDISAGDSDAAIARLEAIRQDAEAGTDLQQRASQLIVALGGTPAPLPDLRQG